MVKWYAQTLHYFFSGPTLFTGPSIVALILTVWQINLRLICNLICYTTYKDYLHSTDPCFEN